MVICLENRQYQTRGNVLVVQRISDVHSCAISSMESYFNLELIHGDYNEVQRARGL